MGDNEVILIYKNRLEKTIEDTFMKYKQENDEKRNRYLVKQKYIVYRHHNAKLIEQFIL